MLANRPLTILLLAAMLSVDALAWGLFRDGGTLTGQIVLSALYFGQFAALSLWLGMGRTNWKVRFAVWLAGSLVSLLLGDNLLERATNFVLTAAYGACVALAAWWLRRYLPRPAVNPTGGNQSSLWQFSLLHLMVWMTLVAVVSATARYSDLAFVFSAMVAAQLATMVLVPLASVVLLYGREHVVGRFALLLAACGLLGICFVLAHPDGAPSEYYTSLITFYLIMGLVTGIWVIVVSKETLPAPDREET